MKIHLEQFWAKDKFYGKKSGFVDSGFVKTCNELVIGYNIGRNITNDNKNAFNDHIKKCPGDKPYCKVSTYGKKVARNISWNVSFQIS